MRFRRRRRYAHPRHLTVLDAAVKLAGKAAAGNALGVALHQSFGSIVAQVAEVSVEGTHIRVHKVSCVVDCGVVVNPEGVRQQMESAIAFGLSAALHGEITISDGRVQQSNFHDYPMPVSYKHLTLPTISRVRILWDVHPSHQTKDIVTRVDCTHRKSHTRSDTLDNATQDR